MLVEEKSVTVRPSRKAAIKASEKISVASSNDVIEIEEEDVIVSKTSRTPKIKNKAISSHLNLSRQYQRRLDCCEREPFKNS